MDRVDVQMHYNKIVEILEINKKKPIEITFSWEPHKFIIAIESLLFYLFFFKVNIVWLTHFENVYLFFDDSLAVYREWLCVKSYLIKSQTSYKVTN